MKACLIGKTLSHSFSAQLHESVGTEYFLEEVDERKLEEFVKSGSYDFFNVTIPYKQAVLPFLDELDATAQFVGCVNTVAQKDGKLHGYNTDYDGLDFLFKRKGISVAGKNAVILGSGGASKTAQAWLKNNGAKQVTVVGRKQEYNYENCNKLINTQILVNATPVGMFPNCPESLIDLSIFPELQFVADVVYNPLRTKLILQAETMNIPRSAGLSMLVFQALCAEEIWQGKSFAQNAEQLLNSMVKRLANIVLVGMPSCGKSVVAKLVAKACGKTFVDLDAEAEKAEGRSVSEIIQEKGEEYFRRLEEKLADNFGKRQGLVLATGGGTVLSEQNRMCLKQNGFVVYLQRDLKKLSCANRPISQKVGVEKLFEQRKDIYLGVSDCVVDNNGSLKATVNKVLRAFENFCKTV